MLMRCCLWRRSQAISFDCQPRSSRRGSGAQAVLGVKRIQRGGHLDRSAFGFEAIQLRIARGREDRPMATVVAGANDQPSITIQFRAPAMGHALIPSGPTQHGKLGRGLRPSQGRKAHCPDPLTR